VKAARKKEKAGKGSKGKSPAEDEPEPQDTQGAQAQAQQQQAQAQAQAQGQGQQATAAGGEPPAPASSMEVMDDAHQEGERKVSGASGISSGVRLQNVGGSTVGGGPGYRSVCPTHRQLHALGVKQQLLAGLWNLVSLRLKAALPCSCSDSFTLTLARTLPSRPPCRFP